MSERSQIADNIAAWLSEHDSYFSNVLQSQQTRDDGRPGHGYSVTFHCNGTDYQLVVWSEKRIDFHMSINPPDLWTRFHSEEEFYSFARTAFHVMPPIKL